jgi:2-octaprenyl-6-methoxyphenol hydroxylase
VLARLLARGAAPSALAQFGEARALDRRLVVGLTDTMARVFAQEGPAQALLGLGLGVLDTVGPARGLLAEVMMFGHR